MSLSHQGSEKSGTDVEEQTGALNPETGDAPEEPPREPDQQLPDAAQSSGTVDSAYLTGALKDDGPLPENLGKRRASSQAACVK